MTSVDTKTISATEPEARLCGCSFIHPGLTLQQGFGTVQRLGFSHIDVGVGGGNGHLDPVEVAGSPQRFADEVRRTAEQFEMQVNECFTLNFGPPLNSPQAADRQRTRELFVGLCEFVAKAGFRSVLLIPGPVHTELGPQRSLDLTVEVCTELVKIANEHNVLLNIEADCESCANTPEAAYELCRRVEGLGLTLDYSHFLQQHIAAERVALLHPHTRHIHIRQAAPGQIVTAVEDGTIDYGTVIGQLEGSGYRGLYSIEYLSLKKDADVFVQSEARTVAMTKVVQQCLQNTYLLT
jgi:sugar phosphate isomerase/epimerase